MSVQVASNVDGGNIFNWATRVDVVVCTNVLPLWVGGTASNKLGEAVYKRNTISIGMRTVQRSCILTVSKSITNEARSCHKGYRKNVQLHGEKNQFRSGLKTAVQTRADVDDDEKVRREV